MLLNDEDKALIKNLHHVKDYGLQRILTKCSEKTGKEHWT